MRMGIGELGVILAILVLLFGAKRLPQLADGMGKAIRNFKRGLSSDDETDVTPAPHDVTPADKRVADKSSAAEVQGTSPEAPRSDATFVASARSRVVSASSNWPRR